MIKKHSGIFAFHSHPHDNNNIPSVLDLKLMKKLRSDTGQRTSVIITTNGMKTIFDEHGVIELGTISNHIDNNYKAALLKLFVGENE